MDIQSNWEKALKQTEIVRPRVQPLHTFDATQLPYIFLAESLVNAGDTVVRKGEIMVEKPAIILPQNLPQFEGFEFEKEFDSHQDYLSTFFMVRGIKFPSMKYNNKTESLDIHEGKMRQAIELYRNELQRKEDVSTGLLTGPEDCWQFSVLIFICSQIFRQADGDIKRLFDKFRNNESS
ncbi:MAG TPA: hypothetical protein VD913_05165 [bacterium]|nr:hypothetical protein [bacterium]